MSELLPQSVTEAFERSRQIDAPPRAMPPAFYTDFGVAALERERMFRDGWVCVGRVDEVPRKGDYYVTELLDESLIVLRGRDDVVRVLSNVCRHRSSLLLSGKGNTNRVVCPYHNWSYRHDGSLFKAPLMEDRPGFDPKQCALPDFATAEWYGWLFVNLSGSAAPLLPQLESLEPWVHGYHDEEKRTVKVGPEYWPVNWKCLAENFMEAYHLTPVHLKTLHPACPTALARKIPGGDAYTAYASNYPPGYEGRFPHHDDMTEAQQRMSMMVWIYPSFVAAISPNSTVYMALTPTGVGEVCSRWGVTARLALFDGDGAQEAYDFAKRFNAEDKERLTAIGQGLQSRYATPGPLAADDLEGCSRDFFAWAAETLTER